MSKAPSERIAAPRNGAVGCRSRTHAIFSGSSVFGLGLRSVVGDNGSHRIRNLTALQVGDKKGHTSEQEPRHRRGGESHNADDRRTTTPRRDRGATARAHAPAPKYKNTLTALMSSLYSDRCSVSYKLSSLSTNNHVRRAHLVHQDRATGASQDSGGAAQLQGPGTTLYQYTRRGRGSMCVSRSSSRARVCA